MTLCNVLDRFEQRTLPGCADPLSLEEVAALLTKLQEDYYEEYHLFELSSLTVALVTPMVRVASTS